MKDLSAANEKQIYEKQQKGYNIITNSNKKYNETIKMNPKFHLETRDECHRRRQSLIEGKVFAYDQFN